MPEDTIPTLTVEEILANTQAYGFVFDLDKVKKDGRSFVDVPILRIVSVQVFDKHFPGVLLTATNGTSPKVSSQRIGRDFADDNQAMSKEKRNEKIQRLNVEWLLGIKTSTRTVEVEVIRYAGPKGEDGSRTLYDTPEEADAAWLEWQMAQ